MSRRKRQPSAPPEEVPPARPRASGRIAIDLAVLTAIFAATVGIAELAGAANLGVALGIGQVSFAIALVVLLVRP